MGQRSEALTHLVRLLRVQLRIAVVAQDDVEGGAIQTGGGGRREIRIRSAARVVIVVAGAAIAVVAAAADALLLFAAVRWLAMSGHQGLFAGRRLRFVVIVELFVGGQIGLVSSFVDDATELTQSLVFFNNKHANKQKNTPTHHILIPERHQQLVGHPIEQRRRRVLIVDEAQRLRRIRGQIVAEPQQIHHLVERVADQHDLAQLPMPVVRRNVRRPPQRNVERHVLRPPLRLRGVKVRGYLNAAERALHHERDELLQLRLGDLGEGGGVAGGEEERQIGDHVAAGEHLVDAASRRRGGRLLLAGRRRACGLAGVGVDVVARRFERGFVRLLQDIFVGGGHRVRLPRDVEVVWTTRIRT